MQAGSQQGLGWVVLRSAAVAEKALGIIRCIAFPSLTQLALRLALAVPFWKSGILKWDGFLRVNDSAIMLFTDEFKLHLPGGPYDFPAPAVMAFLSGCGEIGFPVLLVLGLGTRFAATGLLFMTLIVELTVPDGWPIHITWAAMALAIMAWGPGRVSADQILEFDRIYLSCDRHVALMRQSCFERSEQPGQLSSAQDRPLCPGKPGSDRLGEDTIRLTYVPA